MKGLLYVVALILAIGWALGFFSFGLGGLVHLLLAVAVLAVVLAAVRGAAREVNSEQ